MNTNKRYFASGKLHHDVLQKLISDHVKDLEILDNRVILGSNIGEDAAVIDYGDKYLVAKTDPITFATNEIGYYVVNVNVNDVVCTGARPKWFQSTILLPEKLTNEDLIRKIFRDIHDTCKNFNITVIGGHTEITTNLNRPIIVGCLLGEMEKDELVKTSGAEEGDALLLTKGIFIEGTAIIAREKENVLRQRGFEQDFIEKCKNYLHDPGISVYKEALLANNNFKINSLHDPTEGGLACGIAEMAKASNLGIIVEEEKIKVWSESQKLSEIFNLNPINTISSGSLLIAINENQHLELIELLLKNDIFAEKIGNFTNKNKGLVMRSIKGTINPLSYSETDEILKIYG